MRPMGDGFQVQYPCAAVSNFNQDYNQTEILQSWCIFIHRRDTTCISSSLMGVLSPRSPKYWRPRICCQLRCLKTRPLAGLPRRVRGESAVARGVGVLGRHGWPRWLGGRLSLGRTCKRAVPGAFLLFQISFFPARLGFQSLHFVPPLPGDEDNVSAYVDCDRVDEDLVNYDWVDAELASSFSNSKSTMSESRNLSRTTRRLNLVHLTHRASHLDSTNYDKVEPKSPPASATRNRRCQSPEILRAQLAHFSSFRPPIAQAPHLSPARHFVHEASNAKFDSLRCTGSAAPSTGNGLNLNSSSTHLTFHVMSAVSNLLRRPSRQRVLRLVFFCMGFVVCFDPNTFVQPSRLFFLAATP